MGSNPTDLILRSVLGFVLGIALSACSSDVKKEPEPNIFPANYKQEILDTLMTTMTDPTNARDAYIGEPVLATVSREPRYTVCVRFNGRDVNRQYMGSKDRIGIFYGGHLNQLIEPNKDECTKATYRPFPELEKLCLAAKCQ